jgi:flavin reductase (DIM6/NTAB) family NADH-FMN oxidoreductase RutF
MINQIQVKPHTFHQHALDVLKCGLFVVTETSDKNMNRFTLARVTKVSLDPPIVSIAFNKLVGKEKHLDNCEVMTIHVFADDPDADEMLLGEEMRAGQEIYVPQLSLLLKERCAFFNCRKVGILFEEDLKIVIAKVEFSRLDSTKAPRYFSL